MNYTEAINLARNGDDRGFNFLYAETFKSKYYLALQYMKNEDAAQDVLQDAYMKAFANLDMLKNPEAFSGWFGRIVANTAKNALVKKNPMLFTDVAAEDNNEGFEYQIEDDNNAYQPETAYTKQETQEMVHELLDKLPAEQRMCVLMFHIEGNSIKEIAATLGCSDNTVKSRLKYGRDNLKIEAEKLQKKGYKLYSLAPIPLLLYLLRTDLFNLSQGGGSFAVAGNQIAREVLSSQATANFASISAGAAQTAGQAVVQNTAQGMGQTAGTQVAKAGFLHTVTGKVAVALVGLCLVGGVAATMYGVSQMNSRQTQEVAMQEAGGGLDHSAEVVVEATPTATPVEVTPTPMPTEEPEGPAVDEIYAEVRRAVANQEPGYEILYDGMRTGDYGYIICDIDGDGIDEMIVGAENSGQGAPYGYHWSSRVFSCEKEGNGYSLKPINGEVAIEELFYIEEAPGLYKADLVNRARGELAYSEIRIENGELLEVRKPEHDSDLEMGYKVTAYGDFEWTYIEAPVEEAATIGIPDGKYEGFTGSKNSVGFYSSDGSGVYHDFDSNAAIVWRVKYEADGLVLWGEMMLEQINGTKKKIKFDETRMQFSDNCMYHGEPIRTGYYQHMIGEDWIYPETEDNISNGLGGIGFTVENGKIVSLSLAG